MIVLGFDGHWSCKSWTGAGVRGCLVLWASFRAIKIPHEWNEQYETLPHHRSLLLIRSFGRFVLTLILGSRPSSKYTLILTTAVGRSLGPSFSLMVMDEGAKSS